MVLESLDYYQRRIVDELAAAEHASCSQAADAHRELAERYRMMCDEAIAVAQSKVVRLPTRRDRAGRTAGNAEPASTAR